jgi:signal transduction histidine kinase
MDIEQRRKQILYEQVILLHIFCVFLFLGVTVQYLNVVIPDFKSMRYAVYFAPITGIFILEILIFYWAKDKLTNGRQENVDSVILVFIGFPLVIAGIVIFIAGDMIPYVKLLFILPVIIAGSIAGRKAVYWAAVSSIALLIVFDLPIIKQNFIYGIFDHNFILICTILIAGWFCGSVSDIESSYRQEISLSKQKMEDIINFLPDATFVVDTQGRVVTWNKAMEEMTGIKSSDVLGKGNYEYTIPFYGVRRPLLVDMVLHDNKEIESQYLSIQKNNDNLIAETFAPGVGKKGAFLWTKATPLYDEKGNIVGGIESLKDITEIKMLQQEIERVDRLNLVGEMAASIAHEVRNPMTTVRGMLQLLGESPEYNKDKTSFNLMIEELDRANVIISEYLALARNKIVDLQEKNLNNIITAISPLLKADALCSDKNIVIELGEIADINVDEKEIRQLILNLVRNGLEAMCEGENLTIQTFTDGDDVVLSIKDDGPGIAPEVMEKIGSSFITTKESGTGLGLPVCYSIAARHNASIKVETGSFGTNFLVFFKAVD